MKKRKFDLRKSFDAIFELQIILFVTKLIVIDSPEKLPWMIVFIPLWMIIISFVAILIIGLYLFLISSKDVDNDR